MLMKDATLKTEDKVLTVGIRDLRDGLSRHLASVQTGMEITVTDHGKPIARIVPAVDSAYARLLASGRLVPAEKPTGPLRRRHEVGPISDLIER